MCRVSLQGSPHYDRDAVSLVQIEYCIVARIPTTHEISHPERLFYNATLLKILARKLHFETSFFRGVIIRILLFETTTSTVTTICSFFLQPTTICSITLQIRPPRPYLLPTLIQPWPTPLYADSSTILEDNFSGTGLSGRFRFAIEFLVTDLGFLSPRLERDIQALGNFTFQHRILPLLSLQTDSEIMFSFPPIFLSILL